MSRGLKGLGVLGAMGGLGCLVWAFVPEQGPASDVVHHRDVVVARVGDVTLRADLAVPASPGGPCPAVVCLHGGGWVGGSRRQMSQTIEVLARRGHVAVAPDYRLAPGHRWPACIEDCKTTVRWLRASAGKYRIDPERIGVIGLSAGGHLACLLGVTEPADGLEGSGPNAGHSSRVQAVVSLSGPTDLTAEEMWTEEVLKCNLLPLFGGPPAEKRDEYRRASPACYRPRTTPPFLLIHGSADRVVPPSQVQSLARCLRQSGGSVRVMILEGEGHTWAGANLTRSIDQMLTFLDETLKK